MKPAPRVTPRVPNTSRGDASLARHLATEHEQAETHQEQDQPGLQRPEDSAEGIGQAARGGVQLRVESTPAAAGRHRIAGKR